MRVVNLQVKAISCISMQKKIRSVCSFINTSFLFFLGFISTKPFKKSKKSPESPMFAIDCEMVLYVHKIISIIQEL